MRHSPLRTSFLIGFFSLCVTSSRVSPQPSPPVEHIPFQRIPGDPITRADIPTIIESYNYLTKKKKLLEETDIYLLDMYIVLCEISVEPPDGKYVENTQCGEIPDNSDPVSGVTNPKYHKAVTELTALIESPSVVSPSSSSHSSGGTA